MSSSNRARTRAARALQRRTGMRYTTAVERSAPHSPAGQGGSARGQRRRDGALVIALSSHQGGTGTSTLTANLTAALAEAGLRTLAVPLGTARVSHTGALLAVPDDYSGDGQPYFTGWGTSPLVPGARAAVAQRAAHGQPAVPVADLVARARREFDLVLLDASVVRAEIEAARASADRIVLPVPHPGPYLTLAEAVPHLAGLERVHAELDLAFETAQERAWRSAPVEDEHDDDEDDDASEFDLDADEEEDEREEARERREFLEGAGPELARRHPALWRRAFAQWPGLLQRPGEAFAPSRRGEDGSLIGAHLAAAAFADRVLHRLAEPGAPDSVIVCGGASPFPAQLRKDLACLERGRYLEPWISTDPEIPELRAPLTVAKPRSEVARQYRALAAALAEELG